jgi:hypothetical protein
VKVEVLKTNENVNEELKMDIYFSTYSICPRKPGGIEIKWDTSEWFSSRFLCFRHLSEIWKYPDAVQLDILKLKILVETGLSDLEM